MNCREHEIQRGAAILSSIVTLKVVNFARVVAAQSYRIVDS